MISIIIISLIIIIIIIIIKAHDVDRSRRRQHAVPEVADDDLAKVQLSTV